LKFLVILSFSLIILVFTSCSSKRVYEPEDTVSSWDKYGDIDESIVDITSDVAMLENRQVLTKKGTIDITIPESYRLLALNDGWVISSRIDGKLKLQDVKDKNNFIDFDFKKTIATASVREDIIAILFADNEMALYNLLTKELLLKFQGGDVIAVDSRIVNPYFEKNLVIFSTLDGKIVVINIPEKKKIRTTIVSSEDYFNNIIYSNIIDHKIISATGYKILSMSQKEIREKYEIRNIAYSEKNIYITTKQGDVISLTPDLQLNAKLKFPFAHFLGLIIKKDKIYMLEKEGYIIEAPLDLSTYNVYDADVKDGYVFIGDNKFYTDDEYLSIE
jgi:hypothetical protein